MDNYTVYMHISPSGKKYIGITGQSIERRWGNGTGYKNCISFNRAIAKYGWDNIKHIILYSGLSKEDAERKEVELIKEYNTTDRRYGYNIENGGSTIGKHSEETKRKISIANKGNTSPFKGIPRSEETKKKISEKNKVVLKGNIPWNKGIKGGTSWNKGLKLTEEHKRKLSEAKKGKPSHRIKSILQYDKNNNFIAKYESLTIAGQTIGGDIRNISACCLGKKKTAYGYVWRYESEVV